MQALKTRVEQEAIHELVDQPGYTVTCTMDSMYRSCIDDRVTSPSGALQTVGDIVTGVAQRQWLEMAGTEDALMQLLELGRSNQIPQPILPHQENLNQASSIGSEIGQ
ncbi:MULTISPECIES: hypothetical protein [unclassified Thiocapsa]|uniref:hypothetical protein n=1 Tax=unclassified Thiocapsa TaxID=2641286 RepID=UPI0035AE2D3A